MPYFAPAGSPLVNGIYEAAVILLAFPLVVALGAGSAMPSGKGSRLCKFLGEISYPIYLSHFPFVYMQKAWVQNHPSATAGQHVAPCLGAFALSLFVAEDVRVPSLTRRGRR